jgi:hypothetical protein
MMLSKNYYTFTRFAPCCLWSGENFEVQEDVCHGFWKLFHKGRCATAKKSIIKGIYSFVSAIIVCMHSLIYCNSISQLCKSHSFHSFIRRGVCWWELLEITSKIMAWLGIVFNNFDQVSLCLIDTYSCHKITSDCWAVWENCVVLKGGRWDAFFEDDCTTGSN